NVPLSRRYLARAEECRRMAESFHDAETQLKLLRIAADYDWMAMRGGGIRTSASGGIAPSRYRTFILVII
ncbi:MAG: hypothetical protein WCB23_25600, partial [Pseudolabrys sp.]